MVVTTNTGSPLPEQKLSPFEEYAIAREITWL
jgi:hypothetical protein